MNFCFLNENIFNVFRYANRIIDESMEIVKRKVEEKSLKDGQHAFLAYLLSRQELSEKDIVIIGLSLFGDGLNTVFSVLLKFVE